MSKRHYIPTLRGRFGDWAYYSTLMTLSEIAERIDYAEDLHESGKLSELIQRELKTGRGKEIAQYLQQNEDRFFNALVVAIYGGSPGWHELAISKGDEEVDIEELDVTARYSIGYLSLTDEEKIFALDGQHRLAGIKEVVKKRVDFVEDEVPVIFVAHHNDDKGLRRTRKLFTTLNKQAKPVKKSEIIALDESDMFAIATRHLVENHRYFDSGQVDILGKSPNLPQGNTSHLTTIINLYDVLCIALPFVMKKLTPNEATLLKINRPSEKDENEYRELAGKHFVDLAAQFPEFRRYFASRNKEGYLKRMRPGSGGHILFRPVGLLIFAEILKELRKTLAYKEAMNLISRLPVQMKSAPYANTVWNTHNRTINVGRRAVCRDLLLYMLGHGKNVKKLHKRYATALEIDEDKVKLPAKLV